jgi:hypothetical protein
VQFPGEQNRERDLVELNSAPVRLSVDPEVLMKSAIGTL